MTPLLSVRNLTLTQKHRKNWLDKAQIEHFGPIEFDLNRGETLAIIGENGSGKSVLANLLVGAITPTSGTIKLNGEACVLGGHAEHNMKIRMIFQNSNESLNPGITVGSMLQEPLRLNTTLNERERIQKVDDTLRQVGMLRDHKYFYRHMLSDGQRQRVALARALIMEPEVIVADEPFAALDPSVRSQTVNLIMKLQRDLGLGFIFISHNLGIVRHISDRMLVLQHGMVIETGKTETVFNWPRSEYTQRLVASHQSLMPNF
ncbi:ATP-binding cassette domain-containing protein [Aestuariibacter salexigens]|uniref:ATP-binding cassette domain-containing protein n=1 Tax=Aestuariibacter salexigens TaxID=226010 RepID=UPI0004184F38|nr:ABC transporter ATP-binding protein [Aestuariibacter salexigens]